MVVSRLVSDLGVKGFNSFPICLGSACLPCASEGSFKYCGFLQVVRFPTITPVSSRYSGFLQVLLFPPLVQHCFWCNVALHLEYSPLIPYGK